MSLRTRLDQLERAGEGRLRVLYRQHGLSKAEIDECLNLRRLAMREAPPLTTPDDKVDIEPTVRYLARWVGVSEDELLAEADRIAAGWGRA